MYWGEDDDTLLQQQLGRDGYLALMVASEEALLREFETDLAGLQAAADVSSEYEEYLAHQDALLAVSMDEPPPPTDDRVLCPLCMRGALELREGWLVVCDRGAADGGGCSLQLDARGHPAPLELIRERMCLLLSGHGERCRGSASCRLPLPHEQAGALLLLACPQCGMDVPVV